jgi:hypothetical protein
MIIRAVRPSEYETAGELIVEAYRTVDAGDAVNERQLRDIAGRRANSEVLVAEVDDQIVGRVTFGLRRWVKWTTPMRPRCGCSESRQRHGIEVFRRQPDGAGILPPRRWRPPAPPRLLLTISLASRAYTRDHSRHGFSRK